MQQRTPSFPLGRLSLCLPLLASLAACSLPPMRVPTEVKPSNVNADATLTPATRITRDLVRLPAPAYKVPVAVYAFRDQSGQFKPQPDSNLSNAVTQGAASILVKSLLDSGWYLPIEREGFQNLLNERRVARAIETPADKGKPGASYPQLLPAHFILEGGIVGYESNVRTGGQGANLLGIGAETKYRVDQVTVNLRSVDVRTGQVANSVSVTKTIFSHEVSSSVYKFISYKTLLQAEGGYSTNEPSQLAVKEAVESAVIHLTLQGVRDRVWGLNNPQDWFQPLVQSYMREAEALWLEPDATIGADPIPMRTASLVRPPQLPLAAEPALAGAPAPVAVPVAATATAQTPQPALVRPAPAPVASPVAVVPSPISPSLPRPVPTAVATPAAAPVTVPAAPAMPAAVAPTAVLPAPVQPLAQQGPAAQPLVVAPAAAQVRAAPAATPVVVAPVAAPQVVELVAPPTATPPQASPLPQVLPLPQTSAVQPPATTPPAPASTQVGQTAAPAVVESAAPAMQVQSRFAPTPTRQPVVDAMSPFIPGWGRPKPLPKEDSEQDSWLYLPGSRPLAYWASATGAAGVN